jgi:hypothetical protein
MSTVHIRRSSKKTEAQDPQSNVTQGTTTLARRIVPPVLLNLLDETNSWILRQNVHFEKIGASFLVFLAFQELSLPV